MNSCKHRFAPNTSALVILSFVFTVHADPVVDEVSGDVRKDETITITGSDFGEIGSDYRRLWDTVDNQEAFDSLPEGQAVPEDSGPWTSVGSPWHNPIRITREGDLRHEESTATYIGRKAAYVAWPREFDDSNNRNFYLSWWFKTNDSLGEHGGHNKLVRIWDHGSGEETRISWTQRLLGAYETKDGDSPSSWENWQGLVAEWNRLEVYVNSDSGIIKTWTNGELVHSVTDFYKQDTPEGLSIRLLGFDPNYKDPYSHIVFRMDDIYVSSNQARVEISTSPTWKGATNNKEVQPFSSWTDGKIEFAPHLGSLPNQEDLYAYIVDENGNVNSDGFPLAPCLECPEATTIEVQ